MTGGPQPWRRGLGLAAAAALAGGGLVLLAAGRPWAHAAVTGFGGPARPAGPVAIVAVKPADAVASPAALGLLAVAAVAAVLGTRGGLRRVVGALLLGCGAGVVALAAADLADLAGAAQRLAMAVPGGTAAAGLDRNGWPAVAVAGGLLAAAAGVATMALGPRWPGLGARFTGTARPRVPGRREGDGLWAALDAGVDPTAGEPESLANSEHGADPPLTGPPG